MVSMCVLQFRKIVFEVASQCEYLRCLYAVLGKLRSCGLEQCEMEFPWLCYLMKVNTSIDKLNFVTVT